MYLTYATLAMKTEMYKALGKADSQKRIIVYLGNIFFSGKFNPRKKQE